MSKTIINLFLINLKDSNIVSWVKFWLKKITKYKFRHWTMLIKIILIIWKIINKNDRLYHDNLICFFDILHNYNLFQFFNFI